MRAIAIVKLYYNNDEGFGTIAELVSHIQSGLDEQLPLNAVGYELENISIKNTGGSKQEVFANDILFEGSPHTTPGDKNV